MSIHWALALKQFAGLIAVLNPLGAVPIFLSLTEGRAAGDRISIARTTTLTVVTVLLISALAGQEILTMFGISMASFRVGGGILILLMAIAMLHAKRSGAKGSHEEEVAAADKHEIATVPLGMPLLAGPGSIGTVILYRDSAAVWWDYFALVINILLMGVIVYVTLRWGSTLAQKLGRIGLNVIMRVMGLILAAIAVEFIASGLSGLFPGLLHVR